MMGDRRIPGLEKRRDPGQPGSWITLLFGLLPGVQARPPTANVAAIFVVVGAEFFAQSRRFIEEHEQMYPEGDGSESSDQPWVGMSEDDPKADPSGGEAEVHWVAHVAVGTDDHQMLRRSDRSGCAAAGPAEVPDAAQGDGETQHGGNSGQPAPARGTGDLHAEAEPVRQQPEPQGVSASHHERDQYRCPATSRRGWPNALRMVVSHRASYCNSCLSLLRESCDPIEESDQVLPNEVIDDQHRRKNHCQVRVVDLHQTEVDEAAASDLQEAEATTKQKSRRRKNERKNRA